MKKLKETYLKFESYCRIEKIITIIIIIITSVLDHDPNLFNVK